MIKVSDYIVKFLEEYGLKHIFMISGGGAMHLNDSFGRSEKIEYICNHHEQASAIAAEGYARLSGSLSAVCVTTGPGGINALNGVFGQWTDSVPVLYISGQVKTSTLKTYCPEITLRQLGDQEADIINIVKPITKMAEQVQNPEDIKYLLQKAVHTALEGRKGPVWIDIPLDIQGAYIKEENLREFSPPEKVLPDIEIFDRISKEIKSSKRPLIVAGSGINISNSRNEFSDFVKNFKIPVVTTHNGFDVISTENPYYIGRIGTLGQRAGNFALQNADLVLFLGTRNNVRQTSYNPQDFARKAKKIVVDIDKAELEKPTLIPDIPVNMDLKEFFKSFKNYPQKDFSQWLNWCKERKEAYPVVLEEYKKSQNAVNPYYFVETLTKLMPQGAITVAGNGTASVCLFQASSIKENQRFIVNSGNASMGYDIPASIGAYFANENKDVICIAGDGSLMMNLQELQTVKHHNLPIKLFILNNSGYSSIKQTQKNFFEGRLTASNAESGVSFPDFIKVAEAFGIFATKISNQNNLEEDIKHVLFLKGTVVCEVILEDDYIFQPKVSSEKFPDGTMISKPLEDMFPFLDRKEFSQNILD